MPATPATTPRFGAPRYLTSDVSDFGPQVNAISDALDLAAKFTSSLSTARPSAPVVDQYNYSTDTDVLERWNGTAWVRPTPKPHAASHQDGGTDALTVREAMMATGATGLGKGSFSAYRNTAFSMTTGQTVSFDAEEWDVSNWHDITNGRFTPQLAGYYRLSWLVTAGAVLAADVYWLSALHKNGTRFKDGQVGYQRGAASSVNSHGSAVVLANGTTDYFQVGVLHGTGATQAVLTGAGFTYFQGEIIGRS